MSDVIEHARPSERELALSAPDRHIAFHRNIEARASEFHARRLECPAQSRDMAAPLPVSDPLMPIGYWFRIVDVVQRPPFMREVKAAVIEHFRLPPNSMLVGRRTHQWVRARQLAMYLCRELTSKSLPEIGRNFGGSDHSTVLHACRRVVDAIEKDPEFAAVVAKLRADLEALV